MDALLFPLLLLIAVVILAGFVKNLKGTGSSAKDDSSALGYRKKGPLFTPAERSFYGVLLQAIDSDKYCLFGKVRVADLLEPQPSRNRSQWQKAFNGISAKHFDFVICKTDDLTPVAAIELDDKTHNQKHRQKRDELLKNICKQSDFPLLRVPAQYAYKTEVLKMMLAKELGGGVETKKDDAGLKAEGELA
ncbi:DUF2726 domain-containing protein [uncultured Amphritea sp.]|uniref:DUF2726 domain-containing protein n=1 Tax=uncultured Amphritea sp. TaxID=981605 RepID=UPI002637F1FF|nr:DUF2726 domain-containing protein [uncultured Amphritea sp.]